MRLQRSSHQGTIVPGVILGLVIGLAIAAFIAWTWNREPSYNEKVRSEQERARAERERETHDRQNEARDKENPAARHDQDVGSNKGATTPQDQPLAKVEPRRSKDDISPQDRERFDFYKILPGIEEARPVTEDEKRRARDLEGDQKDKDSDTFQKDKLKESKDAKDSKKKKRSSEDEEQLNQVMSKLQDEGEVSDRDAPRAKPKRWMMQAGAFENEDDAERLKADLAMSGIEAHVFRSRDSRDLPVYRVRLGPFGDEEELGRVRSELKRQGIKATTIPMKEDRL